MAAPLISIITPSYQQSAFIEETLLSVKGQRYANIEHIVIDGLSTDGTQEILNRYASLYNLKWISEKDSGQTEALNKGFRRVTGDIIGWINSDDTYLPGAFNKVMECFACNPDVDWVYGNAYWIDKNGNVMGIYEAKDFDLSRLAYEGMYIPQPTVFVKRELLNSIGCLDEKIYTTMDYDYCLRLGAVGRAKYIPEVLAARRLHEDTKTAQSRSVFYYDAIACLNKFFENKGLPDNILSIREKALGNRHRVGGYQLFSDRQYQASRIALLQALKSGCSFSLYERVSIWILLFESALHVDWIKPGRSTRIKFKKNKSLYKNVKVNWKTGSSCP